VIAALISSESLRVIETVLVNYELSAVLHTVVLVDVIAICTTCSDPAFKWREIESAHE
jgi:hypothetical protein